jgi:hypothetical protein
MQLRLTFPRDEGEMSGQAMSPKRARIPSPVYMNPAAALPKKKRIVFGWYGGKFGHLNWLLPLLPACHHYCEPFAGSAAVLLNREPSPVETYNDIDGEVASFFRAYSGPEVSLKARRSNESVPTGGDCASPTHRGVSEGE